MYKIGGYYIKKRGVFSDWSSLDVNFNFNREIKGINIYPRLIKYLEKNEKMRHTKPPIILPIPPYKESEKCVKIGKNIFFNADYYMNGGKGVKIRPSIWNSLKFTMTIIKNGFSKKKELGEAIDLDALNDFILKGNRRE